MMGLKWSGTRRALAALLCVAVLPSCASVLSATRDDDRSTLARLLRNGSSPDEDSSDGTTALFVAIESSNLPAARLLVAAGADVNRRSRCRGELITPLQKAAIHGDVSLVRFLLDKGADATLGDSHDVFTFMAMSDDQRPTAAITAAIVNSVKATDGDDTAQALLDGLSLTGWTPLAAAAWFGDIALVDALLEQGASVDKLAPARNADSSSTDDWPPLYFALAAGHGTVADHLLSGGADPEQTSRNGETSAQVIADLERRRAEWAEQERQRRRDEEEERRQTFAMFQQGMQAVVTGVQEGLDEARETRERQHDALAELRRAREESAQREQQEREREEREREEQEQWEREQATASYSARASVSTATDSSGVAAPVVSAPSAGEAAPVAAAGDQEEEARQREATREREDQARTKQEAAKQAEDARKEAARQKQEARKLAEEARKQEEARRKEEAAREAREYREQLKDSIPVRSARCRSGAKDYCAHAAWPSQVKMRDIAVYVSVRATCDRVIWTPPQFFAGAFIGKLEEVTLEPKPNCPIEQVLVEVVEVR